MCWAGIKWQVNFLNGLKKQLELVFTADRGESCLTCVSVVQDIDILITYGTTVKTSTHWNIWFYNSKNATSIVWVGFVRLNDKWCHSHRRKKQRLTELNSWCTICIVTSETRIVSSWEQWRLTNDACWRNPVVGEWIDWWTCIRKQ